VWMGVEVYVGRSHTTVAEIEDGEREKVGTLFSSVDKRDVGQVLRRLDVVRLVS
jgi:hypothetical protein